MTTLRCPTCERVFDPRQTTALPFCSERCQKVDLYRWLKEEYGLPREADEPSGEEAEQAEGPDG